MRKCNFPASDVTVTGIEIQVMFNDNRIGLTCQLSDGLWETHPEPIESSVWAYFDSLDEAVKKLLCMNHPAALAYFGHDEFKRILELEEASYAEFDQEQLAQCIDVHEQAPPLEQENRSKQAKAVPLSASDRNHYANGCTIARSDQ